MKVEDAMRSCLSLRIDTGNVLLMIFLATGIPAFAHANLAENPSMEGDYVQQGDIGSVAPSWVGWQGQLSGNPLGDFKVSPGLNVHEGTKSQRIDWSGSSSVSNFGLDGVYQQINSLGPGHLYRASFWHKGFASGGMETQIGVSGTIGIDPNGGVDFNAVQNWSDNGSRWLYGFSYYSTNWKQASQWFIPTSNVATVFIRLQGGVNAYDITYIPDPEWGTVDRMEIPAPWNASCFIDDVVVEPVTLGQGSRVEATSPVAANGVRQSLVTITVLDGDGSPLSGMPASLIEVACSGSGHTITRPVRTFFTGDATTDPNGQTTVTIASRVAETKTVSVTIGDDYSETTTVDFVGSFGPVWYVDADATGADIGSSWTDAFNNLQDALTAATPGEEIRVAQGTYIPGTQQTAYFQLKNGVTLKGGYAGFGEPDPDARDVSLYETLLSGDLDGDDINVSDPCDLPNEPTRSDNSYSVVVSRDTEPNTVLDGFTITAGNANGASWNSGGGMHISNGSPTLKSCTFRANSGMHGAGLTNYNASPTVTYCTFTANHAESSGGGMINDTNAAPIVTYCEFAGNSGKYGGAMRNHNSSPTVSNCIFITNSAGFEGGAMYNDGEGIPTANNCEFTNNSAQAGGGMLNLGSPMLNDCSFNGNTAYYGGGMLNFGNPMLNHCTFNGNTADYGGGLANGENSANISHCRFSGNVASIDGGGVSDRGSSAYTNCLFAGNISDANAGGMFFQSSTVVLVNCTFADNSAIRGDALHCDSIPGEPASHVQLTNCILWNNGTEIFNDDGSTVTISYSDIQGGSSGAGNIDADPGFADPGYWDVNGTPSEKTDDFWVSGDYSLITGSPCIDAGDNSAIPAGITTDIEGMPRFRDDPNTSDTGNGAPPVVDIGAHEFIADGGATYHLADSDYGWIIGDFELLDYIDKWAEGQVGDFDLLDCIDLWAAGHYYWDEASSKLKPGYE